MKKWVKRERKEEEEEEEERLGEGEEGRKQVV